MRLLNTGEVAERLGVSPFSIADRRYRLRIGLPAVKVGRRIGFIETDIDRIIAQGRERLEDLCEQVETVEAVHE